MHLAKVHPKPGSSLAAAITFAPGPHHFVVLSDTHVNDRVPELAPQLLDAIRAAAPEAIFLAGDLSQPEVMTTLAQVAPVYAVQGNQDWLRAHRLPKELWFEVNNVYILLTHGHVNMALYTLNYLRLFLTGQKMSLRSIEQRLAKRYPQADLVIYGHTHFQVSHRLGQQWFLNPGAGYPHKLNGHHIEYALLEISADGKIHTELRHLAGESSPSR
jgi:putative phosphoesterase